MNLFYCVQAYTHKHNQTCGPSNLYYFQNSLSFPSFIAFVLSVFSLSCLFVSLSHAVLESAHELRRRKTKKVRRRTKFLSSYQEGGQGKRVLKSDNLVLLLLFLINYFVSFLGFFFFFQFSLISLCRCVGSQSDLYTLKKWKKPEGKSSFGMGMRAKTKR